MKERGFTNSKGLARVPRKANIELPLAKMFFFCKNAFKWAIARLSNPSGTIFRVKLKFALNHHWKLNFYYANSVSVIHSYGNFIVTLTMVPDWFESRAMAHLKAFLHRNIIFTRESSFWAFLGNLANVVRTHIKSSVLSSISFAAFGSNRFRS